MSELSFSIVIPCFNEAKGLRELIYQASKIAVKENGEFVLVDNGSTDSTLEMLKTNLLPGISWVSTPINRGYGGGILFGLDSCNSNVTGWTHADLQTPLDDIVKAIGALNGEIGFVKGRRRNRPLIDKVFTSGMGIFESLLFKTCVWDINAQPTLFRKDFMATWVSPPLDFSLDLYALLTATKAKVGVKRVDVLFLPRKYGESTWNTGLASRWKFIRRTILYSFTLRRQVRSANSATPG